MKALSVREPWASLIAAGTKTVEVRSRRTHYRGPVLICASKGKALCIVNIVACRPIGASDRAKACIPDGQPLIGYAWQLADVQRLTRPFPVKGRLGFFEVTLPPPAADAPANE